ncbi:MAG: cysteine protease StiP family protein [Methylococcaceae bacterium]|nr:cysteine protease StiP family protein [Methylococcaceae bacterium]
MTDIFTGSYTPNDVQFLLKPIEIEHTPIQAKEAFIQSGKKHYSEMLSHESLPSDRYVTLFHEALVNNSDRLARHLILLAQRIIVTRDQGITLVSLARAGTPIGVLLKHILKRYFNTEASHYSISIIRDIGIDSNALRYLLDRHTPESLVFVDGWTAKGVIAQQLARSLETFFRQTGITIPPELYVVSDLCGFATVAASSEDYLIPSSLLNATVSGLVSRSVYNEVYLNTHDFHGCMYYQQFEPHDLSRFFIDTILASVDSAWTSCRKQAAIEPDRQQLQVISEQLLRRISQQYGVSGHAYIKPGIGEATRVLLRREARSLLLQQSDSEETRHLRWLAESRLIPITILNDLPYRAVALIKEIPS